MSNNDQEFLVQKIRTQHTEKQHTELDALKALDAKVKRPANIFAYVYGSLGAIVMGAGCLCAGDAYDAMYGTMFDLFISDIMMPDIDGFEFAKTVRSLNENIPILFMKNAFRFFIPQGGLRPPTFYAIMGQNNW